MKLTKTQLQQIIQEEVNTVLQEFGPAYARDDEPAISISPENVTREQTFDPVDDVIDDYAARSAKPELMKRMLETVRDFGDMLPLDDYDLQLIDEASKEMQRYLKP